MTAGKEKPSVVHSRTPTTEVHAVKVVKLGRGSERRWQTVYQKNHGFVVGDSVSMSLPNQDRKWHQFWRPKFIRTNYVVTEILDKSTFKMILQQEQESRLG
jgi:hypothetical protein